MDEPAKNYDLGLAYLLAAKKLLAAAWRLEPGDREHVRKLADGLVAKGTGLLASVVSPSRRRPTNASSGGPPD